MLPREDVYIHSLAHSPTLRYLVPLGCIVRTLFIGPHCPSVARTVARQFERSFPKPGIDCIHRLHENLSRRIIRHREQVPLHNMLRADVGQDNARFLVFVPAGEGLVLNRLTGVTRSVCAKLSKWTTSK